MIAQLKNRPLSSLLETSLDDSPSSQTQQRLDLTSLLKNLAKSSCSSIIDSRLSRTIQRFDIVHQLFSSSNRFVNTLSRRLLNLQREKEDGSIDRDSVKSWLWSEVAKIEQINKYATLRRACASFFDSRLSSLLAYLLAEIDAFANLDTLRDALRDNCSWKVDLWLNILGQTDLFKIFYQDMR